MVVNCLSKKDAKRLVDQLFARFDEMGLMGDGTVGKSPAVDRFLRSPGTILFVRRGVSRELKAFKADDFFPIA
jgi:hypothetical protein